MMATSKPWDMQTAVAQQAHPPSLSTAAQWRQAERSCCRAAGASPGAEPARQPPPPLFSQTNRAAQAPTSSTATAQVWRAPPRLLAASDMKHAIRWNCRSRRQQRAGSSRPPPLGLLPRPATVAHGWQPLQDWLKAPTEPFCWLARSRST